MQPNGPAGRRFLRARPVPERSEGAGHVIGPALADHVEAAYGVPTPVSCSRVRARSPAGRVRVQPGRAAEELAGVVVADDDEHAGRGALEDHLVDARDVADPGRAVNDHHDRGALAAQARPLLSAVGGALAPAAETRAAESGTLRTGARTPAVDQLAQLGDPLRPGGLVGAGAQPAAVPPGVLAARRAQVRQPAGPPPGTRVFCEQHKPQVGGRVLRPRAARPPRPARDSLPAAARRCRARPAWPGRQRRARRSPRAARHRSGHRRPAR